MRRITLILAVAGAMIAPATPAFAHGGEGANVTSYRTTVSGISDPMRGLSVRTVEGGARLELTNDTGRSIEVLGYSGEPYLELRPDGVYQNLGSPAAYVNRTLAGDTPVPPVADPTAPPSWQKVSAGHTIRWHDQRTHWLGTVRPPQAVTDPGHAHRLRDWTVPLRDQVRLFAIRGALDYEPPPATWAWWAGVLLLTAALTALIRLRPRVIPPLAVVSALSILAYAVTRGLDGAGWSGVLLLTAALALGAAWKHPPFYLALSGFVIAAFAGFASSDVYLAAVVPATGPGWLARACVTATLTTGATLALTGLLQMRAAVPDPAPATRVS
ncbi:hypothetical protein ACWT_1067 [Actinoplanes sp. SE50]|uniref:hypothetical protein n=1 Tax=unclassified Actinoplanes TaxID=2626549 RepID=UPI00023ECC27|nr:MULTISPECIES: hypothetical protein [unclassified Actinoplanes]AEV82083.1 hypothetical protein ACPL_1186 [Actinoplanes sp. SE50/110]ATO80482.1 hypothetical protein ACWT_1067 [Actinoplanes sp. SE50]SLL97889.1 hypothetical protein ACSP50_1101 [Actinoplanes sp. SE50/110]